MNILNTLRKGVALADSLTQDIQPVVQHSAWIGQDVFGEPAYAPPIARHAIVNQENHLHKTGTGELVDTAAYVGILRPVKPNGAPGRLEPIDPRDRIILPDGTTGPIVEIQGFFDAGTNRPMFAEIWLGKGGV